MDTDLQEWAGSQTIAEELLFYTQTQQCLGPNVHFVSLTLASMGTWRLVEFCEVSSRRSELLWLNIAGVGYGKAEMDGGMKYSICCVYVFYLSLYMSKGKTEIVLFCLKCL